MGCAELASGSGCNVTGKSCGWFSAQQPASPTCCDGRGRTQRTLGGVKIQHCTPRRNQRCRTNGVPVRRCASMA
jgi:hypothetical protein